MRKFGPKNRKMNAAVREYKCAIYLDSKDDRYSRLGESLDEKLRNKYWNSLQHPGSYSYVEHYIRQQFRYYIRNYKPLRAYITEYEEKPGTLAIDFTILVVTTIRNYEEIYEALNLLLDDLTSSFRKTLGDVVPVRYSLMQSGLVLLENEVTCLEPRRTVLSTYLLMLVGVTLCLACWSVLENKGAKERIETIVRKEIEKYHTRGKLENFSWMNGETLHENGATSFF